MSTKSESNISTIWDIFKVEICAEAPGGNKLQNLGGEKDEKRGKFFFLISLWGDGGGGTKRGGNRLFILFLVGGKKFAGRYASGQAIWLFISSFILYAELGKL